MCNKYLIEGRRRGERNKVRKDFSKEIYKFGICVIIE
jgi:hypothetical protein